MVEVNTRNYTLDILRGFLAWAVVLVHVAWMSGFQGGTQNQIGVLAVEGFIVLSGYVITQLIVTKRESFFVFILRRFMRLFPVFVVCLFLSIAILPLTLGAIPAQSSLETDETRYWWQHLLVHLTMLHGIVPTAWLPSSQFAFLPPAWSISLEFQLYLVAPLLVWWLSRSGLRGMLAILAPSALCVVPQIYWRIAYIWQGPGGFLPEKFVFFLLGALIYLFSTKGPNRTVLYRYPAWAVRLGEISYSTYLIHYPVLALIARLIPGGWSRGEKAVLLWMVASPVILASSFLLYRYVEQPGIRLGKKLAAREGE